MPNIIINNHRRQKNLIRVILINHFITFGHHTYTVVTLYRQTNTQIEASIPKASRYDLTSAQI